jgi:thiamine pyrophosphokinase
LEKKKALIIANGDLKKGPVLRSLRKEHEFNDNYMIICADGGYYNCLKLGLYPDLIIGDMDSIGKKEKDIRYISFGTDKDESDTHLALDFALKKNMEKIIIIGATGDRLDHSLANIFLLASPSIKNNDVLILTNRCEISVIRKTSFIRGKVGQTVSLFSLAPSTYVIRTEGFKYPLANEELLFSPARGLSNIFTSENAVIDIKKGCIAIFKNF